MGKITASPEELEKEYRAIAMQRAQATGDPEVIQWVALSSGQSIPAPAVPVPGAGSPVEAFKNKWGIR
jgi:hypothetical protein